MTSVIYYSILTFILLYVIGYKSISGFLENLRHHTNHKYIGFLGSQLLLAFLFIYFVFYFGGYLFIDAAGEELLNLTPWEQEQHWARVSAISDLIISKKLDADGEALFCIQRVLNAYIPPTDLELFGLDTTSTPFDVSQTHWCSRLVLWLFLSLFCMLFGTGFVLYGSLFTNNLMLYKACTLYFSILQYDFSAIANIYDLLCDWELIKTDET